MLHIVIMIGKMSGGLEKNLLNNPEYLRKLDRENGTIRVAPYFDDKFFHREIIRPKLDENGYLMKECIGVEYQCSGIDYYITIEKRLNELENLLCGISKDGDSQKKP